MKDQTVLDLLAVPIEDWYVTILKIRDALEGRISKFQAQNLLRAHMAISPSYYTMWDMPEGYDIVEHAPQMVGGVKGIENMDEYNIHPRPTKSAIVLGSPCILSGSLGEEREQHLRRLSNLRSRFKLPDFAFNGFGDLSVVTNLLFANRFHGEGAHSLSEGVFIKTDTRPNRGGDSGSIGARRFHLDAMLKGEILTIRGPNTEYDPDHIAGICALTVIPTDGQE